ncbi:MAG: LysM domain-containing protein [Betaproteobacteria bacterium]
MRNRKSIGSAQDGYALLPAALALLAAGVIGGCATPPPAAPASAPAVVAAPPAPVEPPKPTLVVPDLPPAQAKAQAQKHAIEAIDQLQNGDEAAASHTLELALALDPANELARKLRDQIVADPEKELGTVFFRYTVQRDDSISKLAQQYLGDRFRFYILARYNEITNPSRLAAGQVIKIPGKAPATPPATARAPARAPEPSEAPAKPAAEAEAAPTAPLAQEGNTLMQKGAQLQRSGDLAGAYAAFSEASQRDRGNHDAVVARDAAKQALIRRYDREAVQAFQRQNLDMAIARWTSILELEPTNQKARLERDRATDLKKRMTEKFGGK